MAAPTFTEALKTEVAILQAQFPDLADALSRAHAIITDGRLFPEDDGRTAMVTSSDGTTFYHVNGHCPCKAAQYRPHPCKHRYALRLYQRACDRLAAEDERWTVDLDADVVAATAPTIPAEGLVQIQGKAFIRFEALLHLAHQRGLVELTTTVVSVSEVLCVCQAVARFADGKTFCDIGDAAESNVAPHLRKHFIRMASTRAAARALRRALDISQCSVEELSGEEVTHD